MSKFVVSARKYRPATFDEVVGQMHVAKTLKNALQTDQLAHAFLFCGPRGVGKTTCARILAKVINCENPVSQVDPCNTCSSCQSFNDNASFNIIELDAASNNSVEHIRTLIEQVRFQPQHGTHKVFIIDEVHMLSSQAFNAFLKTLEEPPPYAIFILATTEKHKIIPTILSRCQIFDFKRIQVQDVVSQLQHICTQEGKKADIEALHLIGQKADGAMRDALSIFDKIASASGDHITYRDVITNLNILDYDYYFKIVDAFLREDLSDVLLIMDEIIRAGFEADQLIEGLSDHFRDLLVCKDSRTLILLDVSDSLKSRYQHQAALTSKSVLLTGLDILNQCNIALPRAKNKRLYTEIALSKINFVNRVVEADLVGGAQNIEKKTKVVSKDSAFQTSTASKLEAKSTPTAPPKNASEQSETFENSTSSRADNEKQREVTSEVVATTISTPIDDSQSDAKVVEVAPPASPTPTQQDTVSVKSVPSTASKDVTISQIHTDVSSESSEKLIHNEDALIKIKKDGVVPTLTKPSGLDAILASVKDEEKQIEQLRKGLNQGTLDRLWNEYASKHNSPSTKAMLEMVITKLENKTVTITVPSNHYKNMVVEEDDLKDLLRTQMGTPNLLLNPIVDKSAFPDLEVEKPKVLMSTKERYQYLAEKHPALKTLVQKLELKPDTGGQF